MAVSKLIIYGARSGIQKAVRRGDPALAKTCFDLIWPVKEHRKWLLWRIPVLVFEDCWPMAGELAKTQAASARLQEEDRKQAWLRFLIRLAIAKKNQDAAWLWYLAVHGTQSYRTREFLIMRDIAATLPKEEPNKLTQSSLESYLRVASEYRQITPYEAAACEAVENRRKTGGMVSDQWNAIAAQVLIHARGLPEEGVLAMLEEQKAAFAATSLDHVQSLPWFCYDMHTRPGLMAQRVWLKNYRTGLLHDEERLNTVWFQLTSAALGEKVLPLVKDPGEAQAAWNESIWQAEKEASIAEWLGVSVEDMKRHWQECLPKIKDLVEWAIRKSGD